MKKRKRKEAPPVQPISSVMEEMDGPQEEGGEKQGTLPALKRRRRWKKYRWMLWLLLLIPVGYFVVQLFIILAPRMRTEVVLGDTMTESLAVTGQVVMASTPIEGGGPYLYYPVPVGQRVSAGAEVAQQFTSAAAVQAQDRLQAIDQELEMLREAQATTAEAGDLELLLSQMHEGVYGMLAAMESGDYANMDGALNTATLAANKLQIATRQVENFQARIDALTLQRAQYESQAIAVGSITAPATGYFVPSMQNDRVQPGYEEISAMEPHQLQTALVAPATYHGGDVAGHIVTDYRWFFFAVLSVKESEKFLVGDTGLQLSFPDAGDVSMPVTVNSVKTDEARDLAVVELYCEYVSAELLALRVEKAEIIFGTQKGLRIEKNAMRLVDIEDEDGLVVTYKGVYVQFGNMVYFRKIDILLEDEYYLLIPNVYTEGVNEVRMYDKVVVDSGGMELYDRKIL